MNKLDLMEKINDVLNDQCETPSEEMRKLGRALIGIADLLEGKSRCECRAIMSAVGHLADVEKCKPTSNPPTASEPTTPPNPSTPTQSAAAS